MGVNSFERRFVCARYLILISRIQRLDIRNQNDRGLTKIKLQIFSDSTKCTGQQVLISTTLEKKLAPIGIELTLNDSEEFHSPYIAVCKNSNNKYY